MQSSIKTAGRKSGYVLILVMLAMAVMLVIFASLTRWNASNSTITLRNNLFNQAENAAESVTENALSYMMRDFTYGNLNAPGSYNNLKPPTNGWPVFYQFSDTNGNTARTATVTIGQMSTTATNLNSQFAGLFAFIQPSEIASTATVRGRATNLSATVYQSIQFALIPLFQFAIFYNMDLEINPGNSMNINGHVHSNARLWTTGSGSSTPLTYGTYVDASTGIFFQRSTNDPVTPRTGNVIFAITNNNPLPNVDPMLLPIGSSPNNDPTNVLAILNPPPAAFAPPNAAAYSTNGRVYLKNAADIIVSNSINGLAGTQGSNLVVYYQNPNRPANHVVKVQPDMVLSSNVVTSGGVTITNYQYAYSFVTNVAFYDYRESDTVQAVQVDVNKFNAWLKNNDPVRGGAQYNALNLVGGTAVGHPINSIYVQNDVVQTSTQLPAVRMVNGEQLPASGLTVATSAPIYIFGDYNTTTNGVKFSKTLGDTTNTYPAALIGDAVTILSSAWDDNNILTPGLGNRLPVPTTINAATLEGIVPSNGAHYSGGVENFLRLLEHWNGTQLTYNGSIVVMFPSQKATNFWDGSYYSVPIRRWGFDLNFLQADKLPPLTPKIKATIRGTWAAW